MEGTGMEPISTALTGIALFQKSVDFIKSNLNTANDIRDIASAVDSMFAGEKQIQKERFGGKSIIGQTKDAASSVIDAKLAKEQMDELSILIDNRFGYGTWRQIVDERAKRLQDEKMREKEERAAALRKRKKMMEDIKTAGIVGSIMFGVLIVVVIGLTLWIG
tara:strand:- start:1542 stop:2030 length:489 start_codon:yes stop_codon:yes gene_type:complete